MGHCTTTATHSEPVMGVAPTNRRVQATFWDLHRFNEQGQIVETWNLTDSLAIMQQLGLAPTRRRWPEINPLPEIRWAAQESAT